MDKRSSPKEITLGTVVGWILGVLFMLAALNSLMTGSLTAVPYFIAALIALPPASDLLHQQAKLKLSRGLKIVLVLGLLFLAGSIDEKNPSAQELAQPLEPSAPMLELEGATASRSYGYLTISGLVTNISGGPMESVQAVATFYDENGAFITSDWSFIDYNPVLAGQSSPFKVMATDNPAIQRWEVSFKEFIGGEIPHTSKEVVGGGAM